MTTSPRAPEAACAEVRHDAVDLESLFLAAVPDIEEIVRMVGWRRGMPDDEVADLTSMVKLSMIESRYRALAKYEGRSGLRAYLQTVIRRMVIDLIRVRTGKWRPSVRAVRSGPRVVAMERLVYREGWSWSEAARLCGSLHGDDADRLIETAQTLRPRGRPQIASLDEPSGTEVADASPPPDDVIAAVRTSTKLQAIANHAISRLSAGDREILRLRFEEGRTASEIGPMLKLRSKRVYSACDRILARLGQEFRRSGLSWNEVSNLVDRPVWALDWSDSTH
jgi:RNA polymerase sigma factor (sigma-70 family)